MSAQELSDTLVATRYAPGRIAVVALIISAISLLHYSTEPSEIIRHEIFQHLYYVPVVLGAYWFGAIGGLATAAFTSLLYVPHIQMTWEHNYPYVVNQYADIMVFHAIGLTVGLLSTSQWRTAQRHQRAASELRIANRELRDSFEQLRRADRLSALGEVAAGLAHEIRNPLGSLQGAIEILRDRSAPDTPEAEFSNLALAELGRLDDLVTEFLAYARPRSPDIRAGRLGDVIAHVQALVGPQADQLDVQVEVHLDDRAPELQLDRQQIQQALFNVLLNAIQASPRRAAVTIVERYVEDAAIVEVRDRGSGIPPDQLARIFDPFFTTKEAGTGLGLAIAQRILESHGGRLEVESAPESGTCVRFRLPLVPSLPSTATDA